MEKEGWSLVSARLDLSSQNNHAEYVRIQREFQKKFSEQLKHNPVTVSDIFFRVDIAASDIEKLLQLDFSLRKKPQKR